MIGIPIPSSQSGKAPLDFLGEDVRVVSWWFSIIRNDPAAVVAAATTPSTVMIPVAGRGNDERDSCEI